MQIMIGIPCYRDVSGETLTDYMRLAYHLGRRTEHDYLIAIKTKSEQFRARNEIVKGALSTGCDYLFFIDDGHVIDWQDSSHPNDAYDIVTKLIDHLEADEKMGICGALYYHRGAECRPVLLKEGKDGGYYWLRDDEVENKLQEVDIQGGGCMMLKMSMFDKIDEPYFTPEHKEGTDLQICKQAKAKGYKVCCDTSIKIGHVQSTRTVITPDNRYLIAAGNARQSSGVRDAVDPDYIAKSNMSLYMSDAMEYLDTNMDGLNVLAAGYDTGMFDDYDKKADYYIGKGKEQLARQAVHHVGNPVMLEQLKYWNMCIDTNIDGHAIDVGCGSAPVGFDFAMRGHHMDFIDIDGAGAYEFLKWRVKKRGLEDKCSFEWNDEKKYDYAFFLDSIEHFEEGVWQDLLKKTVDRLKDDGIIFTNYFSNMDFANKEHINMDHKRVVEHLKSIGMYPQNMSIWVKHDLSVMEKTK